MNVDEAGFPKDRLGHSAVAPAQLLLNLHQHTDGQHLQPHNGFHPSATFKAGEDPSSASVSLTGRYEVLWNTECGGWSSRDLAWSWWGSAVVHPNCPPVVGRVAATQPIWSHQSVAGNFGRAKPFSAALVMGSYCQVSWSRMMGRPLD